MGIFKPPGELGKDAHQDGFYSQSIWNTMTNVSVHSMTPMKQMEVFGSYESSHLLPLLEIEVDEERIKTNPSNWRNERGKPCKIPKWA